MHQATTVLERIVSLLIAYCCILTLWCAGLDRLQKLIKGLDPDAEEEDEELDEDGVEDEVAFSHS